MRVLSCILGISLLFAACSKDDAESKHTTSITLLSPINAPNLDFCCTQFTWASNQPGPYQFELSTDAGFTTIVHTAQVDSSIFTLNQVLMPNALYYWRVKANGAQASSSFKIKPLVTTVAGIYPNAIVHKYSNVNGPNITDTTYTDMVEIAWSGNDLWLKYPNGNINEVMELKYAVSPGSVGYNGANSFFYQKLLHPNGASFVQANLYYEQDSIKAVHRSSGAAGMYTIRYTFFLKH